MSKTMIGAALSAAAAWGLVALQATGLSGVDLALSEIGDSGSYYVYSYGLVNPPQSTWGIATVAVGIGASSGTPGNLAVTGDLFDLTLSAAGAAPHAEVGPITPAGWEAALTRRAELAWYPPSTALSTDDSVAPGATKTGFGIRSSYLPGITSVAAEPTVESCCLVPDTVDGELYYPPRGRFAVTASTVAPRYMPSEVDLDLLQSQASAVCTNPLWITDSTFCALLSDTLDAAEARLAVNNYWGAAIALDTIYSELLQRQGESYLHDNAFWLLFLNTDAVYADLFPEDAQPAQSTLCAHGPSGTTAYFTVVSTGDSLLVSSPHAIVAEVPGVDPEGSSCGQIWDFPLFGTELVDVWVRMDSVTAGREIDEIYVSFGMAGDTTIAAPQDSVLVSHDGAKLAEITFHLKTSGGQ